MTSYVVVLPADENLMSANTWQADNTERGQLDVVGGIKCSRYVKAHETDSATVIDTADNFIQDTAVSSSC